MAERGGALILIGRHSDDMMTKRSLCLGAHGRHSRKPVDCGLTVPMQRILDFGFREEAMESSRTLYAALVPQVDCWLRHNARPTGTALGLADGPGAPIPLQPPFLTRGSALGREGGSTPPQSLWGGAPEEHADERVRDSIR